jgi:hypothetical protein
MNSTVTETTMHTMWWNQAMRCIDEIYD